MPRFLGPFSFSERLGVRIMKFESQSGGTYWFDNTLGISFPFNPSLETMVSADPSVRTSEINQRSDVDAAFNARFMEKMEKVKQYAFNYPKQKITPKLIRHQILREGLYS